MTEGSDSSVPSDPLFVTVAALYGVVNLSIAYLAGVGNSVGALALLMGLLTAGFVVAMFGKWRTEVHHG